jgi:hypothetical protein
MATPDTTPPGPDARSWHQLPIPGIHPNFTRMTITVCVYPSTGQHVSGWRIEDGDTHELLALCAVSPDPSRPADSELHYWLGVALSEQERYTDPF